MSRCNLAVAEAPAEFALMSWMKFRFNQNAVTARIVWPVAAVLLSLLSLAFLALVWTGQRANELALERQINQMNAALALKGQHALSHLRSIATSSERLAELHNTERYRVASQSATILSGENFEVAAAISPDNTAYRGSYSRRSGDPVTVRAYSADAAADARRIA